VFAAVPKSMLSGFQHDRSIERLDRRYAADHTLDARTFRQFRATSCCLDRLRQHCGMNG